MTRRRAMSGGVMWMLAASVLVGAAAGCQTEQRVVRYKPFFAGMAEATGDTTPVLGPEDQIADPTVAPTGGIVQTRADGSVRLISRSPQHLMTHIERVLAEDQAELFLDQVLSERIKEEYFARGEDPRAAWELLRRNRSEVLRLFARMPMAERTPNVIFKQIGPKTWSIRLTGQASRGLRYVGFDASLEGGGLVSEPGPDGKTVTRMQSSNWRLLWFALAPT